MSNVRLTELRFIEFLTEVMPTLTGSNKIWQEVAIGPRMRPDFIVETDTIDLIVEAKREAPQTYNRFQMVIDQLKRYSAGYTEKFGRAPRLALAVPDAVSQDYKSLLASSNIETWDRPILLAAAESLGIETEDLFGPVDSDTRPIRDGTGELPRGANRQPRYSDDLAERLGNLAPGRLNWSAYQSLCGQILDYIFCPPMEYSIAESRNQTGTNRRDFIYPNYAIDGFWAFMRIHYEAHYVVVDAKNYKDTLKKDEVLQIAHYLTRHGTGLFGLIACRNGASSAARAVRREQWILHDKLIVFLDDSDLRQMLENRQIGAPPEAVIRQKIEDFRLEV